MKTPKFHCQILVYLTLQRRVREENIIGIVYDFIFQSPKIFEFLKQIWLYCFQIRDVDKNQEGTFKSAPLCSLPCVV